MKLRILSLALLMGLSSAAYAQGALTANVGVTSNYIWRGVTQTNDDAAVSGGVDWAINKNFYAGTWVSSLGGGGDYELDFYGGYVDKFGEFDFDAGLITYQYPKDGSTLDDFTEAYAGTVWGDWSAKVSMKISDDTDIYLEGAWRMELPDGFDLSLHVGHYSFDTAGATDYDDYSATVSKGDFSIMLSDTSKNTQQGQSDNLRVSVSWGKTF